MRVRHDQAGKLGRFCQFRRCARQIADGAVRSYLKSVGIAAVVLLADGGGLVRGARAPQLIAHSLS